MTRTLMTLTASTLFALAPAALASEAQTSASAGSNRFNRNGTATATAQYQGGIGFAKTRTKSGKLNIARGIAVGFDKDGLSLSISNAVAGRRGPALATTFNMTIGADGKVSHSLGVAISNGPIHRSASAGGKASSGRRHNTASSVASGKSDRFGTVRAATRSHSSRVKRLIDRRPHRRPRLVLRRR